MVHPSSPLPLQVNEAFKDLSQIVEGQGELLNQVEVNVIAAHDSTEKGVGFLEVSRVRAIR